jgi:adenylyl- and sulfurtransferase ThiI
MNPAKRAFLVKYGEISLKGLNRRQFEERLADQISRKLLVNQHRIRHV